MEKGEFCLKTSFRPLSVGNQRTSFDLPPRKVAFEVIENELQDGHGIHQMIGSWERDIEFMYIVSSLSCEIIGQ
jgi:hypothetical protein